LDVTATGRVGPDTGVDVGILLGTSSPRLGRWRVREGRRGNVKMGRKSGQFRWRVTIDVGSESMDLPVDWSQSPRAPVLVVRTLCLC
jgi:hypothetical protein